MDSNQLNRVMKSDRMGSIFFRGVFPADRFRDQTVAKLPNGYIINTDPSDEPGSHWVAVYVNGTASNPIGESNKRNRRGLIPYTVTMIL